MESIMSEAFVREGINIFLALTVLLPLIFFIFKHFKAATSFRSPPPLPPGPFPWPLLGNAHQMGNKPHITLTNFAKSYGPLISLKLGTRRLIIGSSASAATEILKTYDRFLSGRHLPHSLPFKASEPNSGSMGWTPECNEEWKYLRTLCRTELFSGKAIESQACLREQKAIEMVKLIKGMEGKVVNIGEVVFATVFNTLSNILLSRDFVRLDDSDDSVDRGMKGLIRQIMEVASAPNISDLYPILSGLDLQGIRKKSIKIVEQIRTLWEPVIKERRESIRRHGSRQRDFLDVLIEIDYTNDQINQLLLELFTAGTDTSTSTIEWAMAELVRNPESITRVRDELSREIKEDNLKDSQLQKLHYLQACVKEALRLHPPAPLLLPHRAIETCQVMNYTIPKNSQIMVNVWAIGRDPTTWEDPLAFKPERFLDVELDFKGNEFNFLPFGAGRRICPGLPLAAKQVPIALASLIHFFDWSLPFGDEPDKLDMNEKFGVTLQKDQPLLLIPKARI